MYDIPEIECTTCGWQGYTLDLVCHPDDDERVVKESRFNVCPDCQSIDSCVDYED